MALNDIVGYPAAAVGAAVVAANSVWGEGSAATLIASLTHDYAFEALEIMSEDTVATGSQDTTIEVEFLIKVDGVTKVVIPYSMRVDTNVGVYMLDSFDRQWIAEPVILPLGSAITVTARASSTSFRNWRVKVRGKDLAAARSDAGTVTLALTPSATELQADDYTDSGTVTLALTPSAVEEHTTFDSDTVTLTLTPSGTDLVAKEYTDSGTVYLDLQPSGTEFRTQAYTDSGTVYLNLDPSPDMPEVLTIPFGLTAVLLDDFNRGAIGANWSTDPANRSDSALQVSGNRVVGSGIDTSGWYNVQEYDPEFEVIVEFPVWSTPGNLKGLWFYFGLTDPGTGNVDGFIVKLIEDSTSGTSDWFNLDRIVNGVVSNIGFDDIAEIAPGERIGIRVHRGAVNIYRQIGGVWTVETGSSLPSGGFPRGYIGMGINTDQIAVDNLQLGLMPADLLQTVDSGTVYLALTPSGTDEAHFIERGTQTLILSEDFNSISDWDVYSGSSGGSIVASGGELVISLLPDEFGYQELDTQIPYDLRNVDATIELVDIGDNCGVGFGFEQTVGVSFGPDISLATFGGVYSLSATDPDLVVPSQPTHLRIRLIGQHYVYYYSLDGGTTFIPYFERDIPEDPSSLYIYVYAYAQSAAATEAVFDNLVVYSETNVIYLSLIPSGTDEYEQGGIEDSGTVVLSLVPSSVEVFAAQDAGTIYLLYTPSGTELRESADAGTTYLTLSPSGTEVSQYVDAGNVRLELTPSGTEFQGRQYADSDTITVTLTASGTEQAQYVDSGTIGLNFTITGTDTFQAVESTTVDLRFTPSGTDEYTGVSHYTDDGTVTLTLTPNGTEFQTRIYSDSGTVTLAFTPSGTDSQSFVFTDSGTATLALSPSGTDEHVLPTLDTGTAILSLVPSGTELHVQQTADVGTVYVVLTPSGIEGPSRAFELYSTAHLRWQSSTVQHRLVTYAFNRFDTVARMA